ncbi:MAG: HVO_2922 family protein [Haloarculaceae archaeon]
MSATFELYQDSEEKWRWRLVHRNGNIIADSGEGYATRQKARQGLQSVKENAPDAAVEEME